MNHTFIMNPTAGNRQYLKAEAIIRRYFHEHPSESCTIHFTEYKGHATELARSVTSGTVYAVGGDGTAHEVLNGLQEGVTLAIIPAGTGNDFWKSYGIESTLESIVLETIQGTVIPADYGVANDIRFLNCANIGVDALVNQRANTMRATWIPRGLVYVSSAMRELVSYQSTRVSIKARNIQGVKDVFLITIMNGQFYGGGFKPAPLALIDDGLLDVCIVDALPKRRIPSLFGKFYKGEHIGVKEVQYLACEDILFKTEGPVVCGLDGEVLVSDTLNISCVKHGMNLKIPTNNLLVK